MYKILPMVLLSIPLMVIFLSDIEIFRNMFSKVFKFIKKYWKNFIVSIFIPCIGLWFTWSINKIDNRNRSLEYKSELRITEGVRMNNYKQSQGVEIPLSICYKISQGKAKSVYVVINNEDKMNFNKLKEENGSVDFTYKIESNIHEITKKIIDMYMVYIDYQDNLYYEYIVMYPRYIEAGKLRADYGNEGSEEGSQYMLADTEIQTFNKYELLSESLYTNSVKKDEFDVLEYSKLIREIDELKTCVSKII